MNIDLNKVIRTQKYFNRKNINVMINSLIYKLNHKWLENKFIYNFNHSRPLLWFDREYKDGLNIDVFKYNFNKENGCGYINQGKYEIIILKSELTDSEKENKLAEFLNINNINIQRINKTLEKREGKQYKRFLKDIKFTNDFVNIMYESKYMKHFYTSHEIEKLKEYWTDTLVR